DRRHQKLLIDMDCLIHTLLIFEVERSPHDVPLIDLMLFRFLNLWLPLANQKHLLKPLAHRPLDRFGKQERFLLTFESDTVNAMLLYVLDYVHRIDKLPIENDWCKLTCHCVVRTHQTYWGSFLSLLPCYLRHFQLKKILLQTPQIVVPKPQLHLD